MYNRVFNSSNATGSVRSFVRKDKNYLRVGSTFFFYFPDAASSHITRRLQKAGSSNGRPLRWTDGFCLRLGNRAFLVSYR